MTEGVGRGYVGLPIPEQSKGNSFWNPELGVLFGCEYTDYELVQAHRPPDLQEPPKLVQPPRSVRAP